MNYNKIYNNIINKAKSEPRLKRSGIYYENHHIVPKCNGGSDDKDNMVLLTAKEHFICHHLLTKMYNSDKLHFAYWAMCNQLTGDVKRDYKVTASTFAKAKEEFVIINSKLHKGKKLSPEHIEIIRKRMIGNNLHKSGEDSHLFGIPRTEDVKSRMAKTKLDNPEKNPQFRGYFLTPKGRFGSITLACDSNNLSKDKLSNRCKNSERVINRHHLRSSEDLTESDLGKTFKELGYSFEPVQL